MFTSLTGDAPQTLAESQVGVSSLMDTWLVLSNRVNNGERTRTLEVIKSRGMPHSNAVREFVLSRRGIDLLDVFVSNDQVLTGRARISGERDVEAARRAEPAAGRARR